MWSVVVNSGVIGVSSVNSGVIGVNSGVIGAVLAKQSKRSLFKSQICQKSQNWKNMNFRVLIMNFHVLIMNFRVYFPCFRLDSVFGHKTLFGHKNTVKNPQYGSIF